MSASQLAAPASDRNPNDGWELNVNGFAPQHLHAIGSLFAVGNGYLGTRASLPEGHSASRPGTFIAGVYDHFARPGPVPELIRTADWLCLRISIEGEPLSLDVGAILEHHRSLDLRRGLVTRLWRHRDAAGRVTRLWFLHCASLADRHALYQRIDLTAENYSGEVSVDLLLDAGLALEAERSHDFIGQVRLPARPHPVAHLLPVTRERDVLTLRTAGSDITVSESVAGRLLDVAEAVGADVRDSGSRIGRRWTWQAARGRSYRLDKLVAVATSRDVPDPATAARVHLGEMVAAGADAVLFSHERAWTRRWADGDIELGGAPAIQKALRLAVYHLSSGANPADERVSIGARGLTGEAYKGHVFWDTEIFMLPFFVLTDPAAARALLMYRYHTLPAARTKARRLGYRGALYAWESAAGGEEAAPTEVIGENDAIIPIQSGAEEQHISADVAYAVWQYWQATRDEGFMVTAGAEILCETARFWASRAHSGSDGRFHIRGVVGPDEYHDGVDDNAYTNLMARWNLRHGVDVTELLQVRRPEVWQRLRQHLQLSGKEVTGWQKLADALIDAPDRKTGLFEQFDGYFQLEDIDLAALEPRRIPADVILGHERVRKSKIIKQADVLMALYLLWDEFPLEIHRANFDYYEPRTAHGSSLSPGLHAAYAARLGDLELAERYLHETAAIDLDDQMGNAAGGVHMAALGSLWQAVIFGFIGISLVGDELRLQPRLPPTWGRIRCPLRWRGRTLSLSASAEPQSWSLSLNAGPALRVASGTGPLVPLLAGRTVRKAELGELLRVLEDN